MSRCKVFSSDLRIKLQLISCCFAGYHFQAAYAQLEAENLKLKKEVDEARLFKLESEQDQARKLEEEEIRKNEGRINKQQFEERLKGEMNLVRW